MLQKYAINEKLRSKVTNPWICNIINQNRHHNSQMLNMSN